MSPIPKCFCSLLPKVYRPRNETPHRWFGPRLTCHEKTVVQPRAMWIFRGEISLLLFDIIPVSEMHIVNRRISKTHQMQRQGRLGEKRHHTRTISCQKQTAGERLVGNQRSHPKRNGKCFRFSWKIGERSETAILIKILGPQSNPNHTLPVNCKVQR